MCPSFSCEIRGGRIVIAELTHPHRILEGKHLALTLLDINDKNQVVGGTVKAGVYHEGTLSAVEGKISLHEFEGRQAYVIVRQQLLGPIEPEAFDQKFQLGAKCGDLDT